MGYRGLFPVLGAVEGDAPPLGFTGIWPFIGAIQGQQEGTIVSFPSSLSVLFSTQARISSAVQLSSSSSLSFVGQSPSASLIISAACGLNWSTQTIQTAEHNFPSTLNLLWEGTELAQPGAFSIQASGNIGWLTDIGSVFYIFEDQTTMNPTGASIASGSLISTSGLSIQWSRTQVPTTTDFSISPALSLVWENAPTNSVELSIVASESTSFDAIAIFNSRTLQPSALSVLWGGGEVWTSTAFGFAASSTADWRNLPPVFEDRELDIQSTSSIGFDAQEIIPPITELSIIASSALGFRGTRVGLLEEDDDDETGYRRTMWSGAAEAERERRNNFDEDDLMVLVAALSAAYAETRKIH